MLKNWIDAMSSILGQVFGISAYDVAALSLSTMYDVLANDDLVPIPTIDAFIQQNNSLSIAAVSTVSDQYENKTKGTTCP